MDAQHLQLQQQHPQQQQQQQQPPVDQVNPPPPRQCVELTSEQVRNLPSRQLAQRIVARDQALAKRWWHVERDAESQQEVEAVRAKARALHQEMLQLDEDSWLAKHHKCRSFCFSKDQMRKLKRWFETLDTNKNGKISVEELQDPMLSIGIVCDTHEIYDLVQRVDIDANGMIDFNEFVQFLTPHPYAKDTLEKHERMFRQLTQQMEHQRDGLLDIHTQLSVERRKFILDAITTRFDERSMRRKTNLMTLSTPDLRSNVLTSPSPHSSSPVSSPTKGARSRSMRMSTIWKNKKRRLDPLHLRQMTDNRLHALEEVLARNETLMRRSSAPDLCCDTSLAAARNSLRLMPLSSLAPVTPHMPLSSLFASSTQLSSASSAGDSVSS